ncbi:NfeD family protein [Pseudonocardia nematodicida]|uniref:NfeD family protein n=1 Tax=Pseudonocardia nematodicida TaxID=1206997 RepID=A0ABV1KGS7_9PSEU
MELALILLLVGVVLVGAEAAHGELFLAMLGGGALAAAAAAALGLPALAVAGVFGGVSIVLVLGVRPAAKRKLQERMGTLERHQDRFIGSAAQVVQRVDGAGGQVRIGRELWTARSIDGEEVLEEGATATVLQVTGAAVLVTGRGELPDA